MYLCSYAYENGKNGANHWIYEGSHHEFWIGEAAVKAQFAAASFLNNLTKQNTYSPLR